MQRWIVAALGILVVVLAVFFLTDQTGDQGNPNDGPNDEAQAVAEAPSAGNASESSQPENTQATAASGSEAVDDQADASTAESERSTTTAADVSAAVSDSQAAAVSEGQAAAVSEGQAAAVSEGQAAAVSEGQAAAVSEGQAAAVSEGQSIESEVSATAEQAEAEQSAGVSVSIDDQTSDGQDSADGSETEDKTSQIAALPDSREAPAGVRPSFDIVRIEGNGEAVLAGRAEPGSDVTLYSGDASLASVLADGNGNWVLLPDRPLAAGSHELTLRARSPDGVETESADAVIVVVPEAPSAVAQAPSGQAPTGQNERAGATTGEGLTFNQTDGEQQAGDDAGSSDALAVLVPREGEGASQVLQQPESEGIQDDQLVLLAVDYDSSGRIVISGRAAPGGRVIAYLDDEAVGQSAANDSGRWVIAPSETVAPGLHRLRIDQVDAAGSVVARVETPFSRAEMLTTLPDERFVIVQPGNSLWRIARRTYGDGLRYSVIYQSNAEQIRDPDLIYPGQIFMLPQDATETN